MFRVSVADTVLNTTIFIGEVPDNNCLKLLCLGAREMAQWLRTLTVLPAYAGSIPNTHMAVHNCL